MPYLGSPHESEEGRKTQEPDSFTHSIATKQRSPRLLSLLLIPLCKVSAQLLPWE